MSKKEMPESIEDVRKKQFKVMEKRLAELESYKHARNEDGTRNYEERDKYMSLPDFARKAVDKEIHDLHQKLRYLKFDSDTIRKDLRDAIMNVIKYYGVEDKMPEIEERFNRYKEYDRLETMIGDLANAISYPVNWEATRRNYY